MQWQHKVSLNWMQARQAYLTASEIKNLLPFTKTGRKREITDEDYMKIMANKMVNLTDADCFSYGAAARGHLLEPYAVDAYNHWAENHDEPTVFHWDDMLYPSVDKVLAFSPDALDIEMTSTNAPTTLVEIKSYGADKHLATAYTPKMKLEERWQIATALAVEPSIEKAFLVLFNPSMKMRKLFVIKYTREDLKDEIEMVSSIGDKWKLFKSRAKGIFDALPDDVDWSPYGKNEEQIIKELEERNRLNP